MDEQQVNNLSKLVAYAEHSYVERIEIDEIGKKFRLLDAYLNPVCDILWLDSGLVEVAYNPNEAIDMPFPIDVSSTIGALLLALLEIKAKEEKPNEEDLVPF